MKGWATRPLGNNLRLILRIALVVICTLATAYGGIRVYARWLEARAERLVIDFAAIRPGQTSADEVQRLVHKYPGLMGSIKCSGETCRTGFTLGNDVLRDLGLAAPASLSGEIHISGQQVSFVFLSLAQGLNANAAVISVDCYPCGHVQMPFKQSMNGRLFESVLTPVSTDDQRRRAFQLNVMVLTKSGASTVADLHY